MSNTTLFKFDIPKELSETIQLIQLCTNSADSLIRTYNFNAQKDTRVLFFTLQREILQSYHLTLLLSKDYLPNLKIWDEQKFKNEEIKTSFISDRILRFDIDIRFGIFVSLFVNIETVSRILGLSMRINNSSTIGINRLLKAIVTQLNLKNDYLQLIDIVTNTRNSMHSGGFFNHPTPTPPIAYKGITYEFTEGEVIDFNRPDWLIFLFNEITFMFIDILNSTEIIRQPEIEHSYSNIRFVDE